MDIRKIEIDLKTGKIKIDSIDIEELIDKSIESKVARLEDTKKKLYTKADFAELLGLHITKIDRLMASGDCPPYLKIGRTSNATVRFRKSDIERWLESRLRRSTSDAGREVSV